MGSARAQRLLLLLQRPAIATMWRGVAWLAASARLTPLKRRAPRRTGRPAETTSKHTPACSTARPGE